MDPFDHEEFELFVHLPGGSLSWRGLVYGLHAARVAVWLLADETAHECFALASATNQITLARSPLQGARRILQIAYSADLAARAHLLHRNGNDVTSVLGNRPARLLLSACSSYDLIMLGNAAPPRARSEMVRYLRANYPDTGIVALPCRDGRLPEGLRFSHARTRPCTAAMGQ